ncbi:MAG TPA: MlaD family protein [Paraburkholderia sp.]|nr:MlaD family protein [Paraburkholderia sp.]
MARLSRHSWFWLAPLLAALLGGGVLAYPPGHRGPRITVNFQTGAGLVAGKTRVRYRDVEIGRLERLRFSADGQRVHATLQLDDDGRRIATCGARFWVVRPRIDVKNTSGLMTAISGTYIDVDVDLRSRRPCHEFVGLEAPPAVTSGADGTRFVLRAASLGSLSAGSPVYFRGAQAGQVLGYSLAAKGSSVRIDVFVKAPFDRFVTSKTRWWQASGAGIQVDASGMRLDAQSLTAVFAGAVAFDTPPANTHAVADARDREFRLANDRSDALRAQEGSPAVVRMRFTQSVRGLSVGAPVEFRGVEVGTVVSIDIDLNPERNRFDMLVTLNLYPSRLGQRYRDALGEGTGAAAKALLHLLVTQGLRGQLRMGSLLTGQKYIALDVFPHAPVAQVDTSHSPVELPTVPDTLGELQDQLSSIVTRIDRMPVQEIGQNLNTMLQRSNRLFERLDAEIAPAVRSTLDPAQQAFRAASETLEQGSPLQSDVQQALAELRRTLVGLNALSGYLERHPEALVWGNR